MFKDIVLEEIYGKLIKSLQSQAYSQGFDQGVHLMFKTIEKMTAQGITVNKQSIIEYANNRVEEQKNAEEALLKALYELIDGKQNSDETANGTVKDEPTEPVSEKSTTVINLFSQK